MDQKITQHDARRGYCRRLGHEVPFSYCRQPGSDRPCTLIADCWWEKFDVRGFLDESYGPEHLDQQAQPRPDKLTTLVDLVEQIQRRNRGEE